MRNKASHNRGPNPDALETGANGEHSRSVSIRRIELLIIPFLALYRAFIAPMIRPPNPDRIIPLYKCSVQTLKGVPTSYIFLAGFAVGRLSTSYIGTEGFATSYIHVQTIIGEGGLFVSYISDLTVVAGGLSVSYILHQTLFASSISTTEFVAKGLSVSYNPDVTGYFQTANALIPHVENPFTLSVLLSILFASSFQAGFDSFDESQPENFDSQPNDGGSEGNGLMDDDSDKPGVIYARVSSDEQAKEGHSLETQVAQLQPIVEENDISLIREPIQDEGLTGTNFEREGIRRVFRLASDGEISYLLTQDVDRLGRTTPETLYFIHILQTECGVELLTPTGKLDVTQVQGLIETTMKSLMSHVAVMGRSRKANNTVIHRFIEQRQWRSWFQLVPLGYRETEDGWIEPEPDEIEIVQDIFTHFLESESYAATRRYVNDEYGDELDTHFARNQVKRLLERRVYIGEPTISVSNIKDDTDEMRVDDANLRIIDETKYERVQDAMDRIAARNSTGEQTVDVNSLVDEFGLFPVIDSSPSVEVICRDCEAVMVKNGQRDLDGELKRHNYLCNSCGQQRTFPKLKEYEEMRMNGSS